MNSELLDFTRRALEKGIAPADVKRALGAAGWGAADIDAAVGAFAIVDFPLPVPKPKPYLSAREVFIYLVLFTALYVSAFNLGALAFDFINRAFPDPATDRSYFYGNLNDSIRWNVASLIVAFPLFLILFRSVRAGMAKDPIRRNSIPRKWLTYITLFIAAVSLISDLTTMVYNALGGELTTRFMLKVATIAIIAGGTFSYLLADMRKDEKP